MSGAISNAIVGWVAVAAGMTGTATAASMTPGGISLFKLVAFWISLFLLVAALFIYVFKVKISEKKHDEIVDELQKKLATEGISGAQAADNTTAQTEVTMPGAKAATIAVAAPVVVCALTWQMWLTSMTIKACQVTESVFNRRKARYTRRLMAKC